MRKKATPGGTVRSLGRFGFLVAAAVAIPALLLLIVVQREPLSRPKEGGGLAAGASLSLACEGNDAFSVDADSVVNTAAGVSVVVKTDSDASVFFASYGASYGPRGIIRRLEPGSTLINVPAPPGTMNIGCFTVPFDASALKDGEAATIEVGDSGGWIEPVLQCGSSELLTSYTQRLSLRQRTGVLDDPAAVAPLLSGLEQRSQFRFVGYRLSPYTRFVEVSADGSDPSSLVVIVTSEGEASDERLASLALPVISCQGS